jgi:TolB-like protein/DNA-binding winged helix-turn-helix (wHTH) protein/Tfp pilus assembly protein PilF
MSKSAKIFYEFGPFRLDASERLLLREGRPIALTPKVFETLLILVRHSGHVVEKDELMKQIWSSVFVEEANLTQAVFTLRRALGESGAEHRFIETVPKRGYRFVAEVRESREKKAGAIRPTPWAKGGSGDGGINSLAVLPFVNVGADPATEYLSDGITENLINSLSQLSGLRVMARSTVFRYKGRQVDPQKVGRELRVHAIVVGRILQVGDKIVVGVEVVDSADGSQIWGEQYQRQFTDILILQEDIARVISGNLLPKLSGAEQKLLSKRYTDNAEAYRLFLMGHYFFWNRIAEEDVKRSIELFNKAIELDPNCAIAYVGLANAYYRCSNLYAAPNEALPKARAAALRALEIDETLAEAHSSLAYIRMFYDFNWPEAESELRRSIELNPGYATGHQRYGVYLTLTGRFDQALQELNLALELDPLSLMIRQCMAGLFYHAREYGRAIEQVRETLEMDPGFYLMHCILGMVYTQQGRFPEAIAEIERALSMNRSPSTLRHLGHAYAVSGQVSAARKVIEKLRKVSKQSYVSAYSIAVIYAGLGERNRAFQWLEKALEDRSEGLSLLKVTPELDSLRAESMFTELLRRVGLAS